ncbi:MAG TPA: hypothetical protein VM618_00475 [Acidimicrobiia bacterium]|nr:hypothetical protein [Acidimicrobiia bacterium]
MGRGGSDQLRAAVREHLDELYDFALTVTWDPEAASDAVTAGVTAIGEREPDRAVLLGTVRSEALTRARPAEPVRVDPAAEPPPIDPEPAELEALALGVLHGLDPRARAVLDLAVRRNLEPHDLAAALDVPAERIPQVVDDARGRADRLLGHYVHARVCTRTCTALASAIDGAPAGLQPLADRVEAHLPTCEACAEWRAELAQPTEWLRVIPDRPAPSSLNDVLLAKRGLLAEMAAGDDDGRRPWWRRALVPVVLVLVVAGAAVVAFLVVQDDSGGSDDATPITALTASSDAVVPDDDDSVSVTVRNTGPETVAWTAATDVEWVTVTPARGRLDEGDETQVTVTIDRMAAPEGEIVTAVRFEAGDSLAETNVTARVARAPVVSDLGQAPTEISATPCEGGTTAATVAATVTDGSGLRSVSVRWTAPDGTDGRTDLTADGDRWSGSLGPFETAGEVRWRIVAVDTGGERTASDRQTLTVLEECVLPDDQS